jgi:hypothetical protein
MNRKLPKYFDDPIYGFRFFLFNKKDFKKYCPEQFEETSWNAVARTIYEPYENEALDVNTLTAVYFTDRFFDMDQHRQASIICHECWHLTELALFNVGVAINMGEINEHIAYYLTFLVENYSKLIYEQVQGN